MFGSSPRVWGITEKKGSKIHIAVDTLGLLLAAHVTPANEQERAQVKKLAEDVQVVTQNSVEVAFVDQGYTGHNPKNDAKEAGIELIVVKLPEARKDLCCCQDAGLWSVVLHGLHVSVDWRVTLKQRLDQSSACFAASACDENHKVALTIFYNMLLWV